MTPRPDGRLLRVFGVGADTTRVMLFRVGRFPDASARALRRGLGQSLFAGAPG